MARERMKHPRTFLTPAMTGAVAAAIDGCVLESDWRIVAAAIESTHMHLLLTYTERNIDGTAKWLAQETTKRVRRDTDFAGPIWC
jgi:REP element-mobilizing transposase RayT